MANKAERFLAEARNGELMSVPEDKLKAWKAAQGSGELSPGLRKYKKQIVEGMLAKTFRKKA